MRLGVGEKALMNKGLRHLSEVLGRRRTVAVGEKALMNKGLRHRLPTRAALRLLQVGRRESPDE